MSLTGASVIASGGDTVQDIRGYRIHTFTTVGTSSLVVTRGGPVEVLVVAVGGGGGNTGNFVPGGGGGAGELIYQSTFDASGTISVSVGSGGLQNSPGADTTFGSLIAKGGGYGGFNAGGFDGGPGGSGGGARRGNNGSPTGIGGSSIKTIGLGNNGGNSIGNASLSADGGGGGGALGIGADAARLGSGSLGTPGGPGYTTTISGSSKTYAIGGFGGIRGTQRDGAAAQPNTGNGGGGGCSTGTVSNGGAGGSGIVIVRYPIGMVWTGKEAIPREIFKYNYPLDSATSVVGAYSFRKLIGSYQGPMIRLIRQSDLTNMDFVGDNFGNLSNVQTGLSASTWIGGSSANVSIWYDQSSAVNHAPYTSDNSYGLPPPFSLTGGIYFQNQNFTTSTTYYYGLKLGTAKTIQACLCNFNLKSGKTNDTAWNSLVAASVDNAGVRLSGTPGSLQIGDRNDLLTTGCYTIFDGVYNSPTSGNFFINSFDVPHKMFANRTVEPYTRGAMLYIGTANPSNSDTLKRRSFYGYMSELVLFSGSVNSSTALTYMV